MASVIYSACALATSAPVALTGYLAAAVKIVERAILTRMLTMSLSDKILLFITILVGAIALNAYPIFGLISLYLEHRKEKKRDAKRMG
jgi:hypothetical protein